MYRLRSKDQNEEKTGRSEKMGVEGGRRGREFMATAVIPTWERFLNGLAFAFSGNQVIKT